MERMGGERGATPVTYSPPPHMQGGKNRSPRRGPRKPPTRLTLWQGPWSPPWRLTLCVRAASQSPDPPAHTPHWHTTTNRPLHTYTVHSHTANTHTHTHKDTMNTHTPFPTHKHTTQRYHTQHPDVLTHPDLPHTHTHTGTHNFQSPLFLPVQHCGWAVPRGLPGCGECVLVKRVGLGPRAPHPPPHSPAPHLPGPGSSPATSLCIHRLLPASAP